LNNTNNSICLHSNKKSVKKNNMEEYKPNSYNKWRKKDWGPVPIYDKCAYRNGPCTGKAIGGP
jgi:hypothetical protein